MSDSGGTPVIGIIGGSGVYEIDGLADARWAPTNWSNGSRIA